MLEGVGGDGEERRLVQELARLERLQRAEEIAVRECCPADRAEHLAEDRLVELLADDGRGLQHLLLAFAQPVYSRGE